MPDECIVDLGVVEGLIAVHDRLGVNAFATRGVVFDLDRQIAAAALDENTVFDRNMRMQALAMQFAMGPAPLEFVLGRQGIFVIEPVAQVGEPALGLVADQPLEGLDIPTLCPTRNSIKRLGRSRVNFVKTVFL